MINFDIMYFAQVFKPIIRALPITISIAIISMVIGFIIGTAITFARNSSVDGLRRFFDLYVSFFRGTPLMVQMFLFFFGLPQILPYFSRVGAYSASIIVLSINSSAYISEVIKASLLAIDKGQMEASLAMGMSKFDSIRRIIFPQALRVAIFPLGNTFIGLMQGTAIVFMIGLKDIMGISKMTAATSYRFFETYLAVGIIYWVMTLIIGKIITVSERRLRYGR